jgi:hypothetical protein
MSTVVLCTVYTVDPVRRSRGKTQLLVVPSHPCHRFDAPPSSNVSSTYTVYSVHLEFKGIVMGRLPPTAHSAWRKVTLITFGKQMSHAWALPLA